MADAPQSIFISHATPADNEIARWLALRLMREGYSVWCDIERLRVGDDFWREIEGEIRTNAAKFILVLSRNSYNRQGVLNELGVASKVAKQRPKRFILPVRADDLPYDDFPIEANRLDAADFSKSWSVGMGRLMQILVEDSVPKAGGGPQEAADWWQKRYSATEGLSTEPEEYSSNRFRITSAPKHVYLHSLDNLKPFEKSKFKPIYPVHQMGGLFVSFAPPEDLAKAFEDAEAMVENVMRHSSRIEGDSAIGVVGYHVVNGSADFVVADLGQGVLSGLTGNTDWAHLQDEQAALVAAARDGATRFKGDEHGFGFKMVFKSFLERSGVLALRSGDGVAVLRGNMDSKVATTCSCAHVPGLRVAISISVNGDAQEIPL